MLTDITYLPYNDTFAYLSTIIDAFTKQVLSYVVSDSLAIDFVLETVKQLMDRHEVSLQAETIIHSDQGCHYTSYQFIQFVKDKSLRQSMSRRGNCWDNAPQESFRGHMKDHIREKLKACTRFDFSHSSTRKAHTLHTAKTVTAVIGAFLKMTKQWQMFTKSPKAEMNL